MDKPEFLKQLNEAQELMSQEKYSEAIILLEKLKEIERQGDFEYNLTHQLYQLISNSHSLYNQQKILSFLNEIAKKQTSITFYELKQKLEQIEELNFDESILRREIELLILQNVLFCKIEGNKLIF